MKKTAVALLSAVFAHAAFAQVQVEEPWVRATVAQQKVTGAFLRITAPQDARLVSARSPVAGRVEIHEMTMENNVMKMRQVQGVELPAGEVVELRPGAHHVMLFDLKRPLVEGETVPLTLVVEGKDGKRESIELSAAVKPLAWPKGGGHGSAHAK